MSTEFHRLEEALKEFLTAEQNDKYNSKSANLYKYNNLKFSMEPIKNPLPHLTIVIGISESTYNLQTTERISGGLGSDERLIRRWLEKTFIKSDLMSIWDRTKKIKPVISKSDLDE